MYRVEKLRALLALIYSLRLHGWEIVTGFSEEQLLTLCNGIGPAWLPGWVCWLITTCRPVNEPGALIHDLRYYRGGDWLGRLMSDLEYLVNGIRVANFRYRWFNPLRYLNWLRSVGQFIILTLVGWAAWNWEGRA